MYFVPFMVDGREIYCMIKDMEIHYGGVIWKIISLK